jgi:hypothetical protein
MRVRATGPRAVDHQMQLGATEPAHGGFPSTRPVRQDLVGSDPASVTHARGCRVDERGVGAAPRARLQIATEGHKDTQQGLHKMSIAHERGDIWPQRSYNILSVIMSAHPVVATMKVAENCHDFAASEF